MAPGGQGWDDVGDDVSRFLDRVVTAWSGLLGERLVGVYLHGSLAMGSFHRARSDLDLLVVVDGPMDAASREAFARQCVELSRDRPIAGDLEVSVLTSAAAAHPDHPVPYEVHYGEGNAERIVAGTMAYEGGRDPDLAAHLTVARARGIALAGPPPEWVLGPVPHDDFLEAVLDDFDWILDEGLFGGDPVYAVLNACRVLQAVMSREPVVASKEEGAAWALGHLPPVHRPLVEQALEAYDLPRGLGPPWDAEALRSFRMFVTGVLVSRRSGRRVPGLP